MVATGATLILLALTVLILNNPPGTVTGHVLSCPQLNCVGGTPISNQPVIFVQLDGTRVFTATSDSQGTFSLTLPPGHYAISYQLIINGHRQVSHFEYGPSEVSIGILQHADLRLGFYSLAL